MPKLLIKETSKRLQDVKAGHVIKFPSGDYYLKITGELMSLQTFTVYPYKDFSTTVSFEDLGRLEIESQ